MAKIPTIDPTGNKMTTDVGAVRLDPNVAGTPGMMLAELGRNVSDIAQRFEKVQADSEALKASNQFEAKKLDILTRADQDPDSSQENRQKYYDELNTAHSEAAKANSVPLYRNQWEDQNQSNILVSQQHINSSFYKKKIVEYDAEFKMNVDNLTKDYVLAPIGSKQSEAAILTLHKTMGDYAFNTQMGPKELASKTQEIIDKWNKEKTTTDAKNNPKKFNKDADAGKYGDPKSPDVLNAKDVAAREIFIRDRVQKYRMQDNENNISTQNMQDIDISRQLEEGMFNKTISRSYYNTMSKNMKSKIGPTAKTDPQTYASIMDTLADPKKSNDDKLKAIVDANTSGKLNKNDMMKLMELHIIPGKEDFQSLTDLSPKAAEQDKDMAYLTQKEKQDEIAKKKSQGWGAGINALKKEIGDSVGDLVDIMKNIDVKTAMKDIPKAIDDAKKEHYLHKYPVLKGCSAQGSIILDNNTGKKYKGYPDGRIEVLPNAN